MDPHLTKADHEAEQFVNRETEFHLGALVTEQPHPGTRDLTHVTQADTADGISRLLAVDRDILRAAVDVFRGPEPAQLEADLLATLRDGGRVFVSGCGSTGRLAILLETAWREYWLRPGNRRPGIADRVVSLMTGGERALIRSVESFEDYISFGRHQVLEAGISGRDLLLAVSEGGETSSVIGTIHGALEVGARAWFVYNNPTDLLCSLVTRSREVITDPRVRSLPLVSGPMAVAGSTRMQATTFELLVLGHVLESVLEQWPQPERPARGSVPVPDPVDAFTALLERLGNPGCIASMADWTEREAEAYRAGGLVTYFADHGLVDVLCDTTERSPTFKLPPFHPTEAVDAPEPWALVKNPIRETPATWERALCRPPRGLDWPPDLYRRLGAAPEIAAHPPELGHEVLHHYRIGREPEPRRWESGASLAILLRSTPGDTTTLATAFRDAAAPFTHRAELAIGPHIDGSPDWGLVLPIPDTPLRLYHHLALKLVLNTVSTATMARTGRILGNWMICVETTNKKLVDRGTRLVADLTGRAYADACRELFRTRAWLSAAHTPETASVPSAVALTVYRLRTGRHADLQGPPPSAETVLTALCSLPPLPSPESRPADP